MDISAQGSDLIWRASELDKGLLCARQLGYSRLGACTPEQEPLPMDKPTWSWALIGGLALDETLSTYERVRMSGADPRDLALEEFYVDRFRATTQDMESKGTIVANGDETPTSLIHDGRQLLGMYREFSANWQPVGVQVEVSTQVEDITLVGHIDYIRQATHPETGSLHKIIGDWKFTKKTPSQMPAATYSRAWAYDLMAGDGSGATELVYLRKGLKTPKIETSSHFVTKGEHEQVKRTVKTLAQMYKARYFPMTSPESWVCDPKWCGFYAICRGRAEGPLPIPGER